MPTLEEITHERQWRSWRPQSDDPEVLTAAFERFCADVWKIRFPGKGAIPFTLTPEQRETAFLSIKERGTIVLKARQIGFSTLYSALTFWECFFWEDRNSIFLSKKETDAMKLMAKSRFGYRKLPQWVRDRGPRLMDQNLQRMTFSNESYVEAMPSRDDPARGESAYRIIADEFAFLLNPEEAWGSMEPAADAGGRINLLSTANGGGTLFERLWNMAREGDIELVPLFFGWSAAGWRDEEWYARKKRSYKATPHLLHQEYPQTEDEAFIRSGNSVFDIDLIRGMEESEPVTQGLLAISAGFSSGQWIEVEGGDIALWARPSGEHYVIGADVAKGLEHGDWSTAHILSAKTGEFVGRVRTHLEPDLWGEYLAELAHFYGGALLGIENNTFGLSANKAARKVGYKNIFHMRRVKQKSPDITEELGWATTATTKPYVINGLQVWLRDHNVPDRHTNLELRTYVRNEKGQMGGSPHDDLVMSLAIAVEMLKYAWHPDFAPREQAPHGSWKWWMNRMDEGVKPEKPRLGHYAVR